MKKYFITGLITLTPLVLTILIFVFLFDFFTQPFLGLVENILKSFDSNISEGIIRFISRIVIFIFLLGLIFLLGVIGRWFLFKSFLNATNKLFSKIPVVKTIYRVLKDIMSAFFSPEGRKAFKAPAMVPFPNEKSYAVGFSSGDIPKECLEKLPNPSYTSVFIPTAPHPISGYMIMVANEKVHNIPMTNEEVVKFTVSCGVVIPEEKK